jgi:hypothetical protein
MAMNKPGFARRRNAGIVLVAYMCMWWYTNPIGLHRKVQVAGITVPVPFGWVLSSAASRADPVEYVFIRRANIPFRPWMSASFAKGLRGREVYTMESARRAQDGMNVMYEDTGYYSSPRAFELNSGKYTSLCAEATMHAGSHILTCAVVGTPLRFDFMGSKAVDGDAEKMLASLT